MATANAKQIANTISNQMMRWMTGEVLNVMGWWSESAFGEEGLAVEVSEGIGASASLGR